MLPRKRGFPKLVREIRNPKSEFRNSQFPHGVLCVTTSGLMLTGTTCKGTGVFRRRTTNEEHQEGQEEKAQKEDGACDLP